MVDANPPVILKCVPEVIPIRKTPAFARMQIAKRVDVADSQIRAITRSWLGLKQRIVDPRRGLVAVDVLRNHVEIATSVGFSLSAQICICRCKRSIHASL